MENNLIDALGEQDNGKFIYFLGSKVTKCDS